MMDWNNWLNDGCQALGMQSGIVTVCCGRHLTVVHHADRCDLVTTGDSYDRANTFCNQVMVGRNCFTYNAPAGFRERFRLGNMEIVTSIQAYIGFPLIVRDNVFGTLSFSSTERKNEGFSAHDLFLVEMMAGDYVHYNLSPNQADL